MHRKGCPICINMKDYSFKTCLMINTVSITMQCVLVRLIVPIPMDYCVHKDALPSLIDEINKLSQSLKIRVE